MSKRLEVLFDEAELRDIQRLARARRMGVAEWVRAALRAARRREPSGDMGKKLEVVQSVARHEYPVADIDAMLGEIERGYVGEPGR